ncbi:MAG: type I polyketide synthase, partial [Streptosporangiaceae bacterium]|nr:type I polyketide synthase [Streptosporangiaceae bacterium]
MADAPIAIIGMGCRFAPDTSTPAEFWTMLAEGRDAVREVPPGRWEPYLSGDPETAATVRRATRFGAFLGDAGGFDAAFFGISPREALSIDPQQRILLEVSWEALEDAGIPPHTLRGTGTGVFVAANSHDYGDRLMADLPRLEAWAVNGAYAFGIANRVSFTLDLRGPSMAIDTACAGSLTALHAACQHLWRAETDLAIAGGVNVMAAPGILIALDAAGATAPDGRSKAFDSSADGYGRGEGAGVVVLKRLRDARRDGDRVLALIRGGGVFHDGAGGGLMAPNGEAQEHMLREVYARSGVPPETIDYVETHGTGTPAGDPVEAATLSRFFGVRRGPGEPCLIGSVKPNIGHLEAGAGIAGVIKTVLAMRNGQLPPSLHDELTGAVDWDRAGLRVVSSLVPWPERGHARRAGVSSFGVGGTITHVILEEAGALGAPGAAGAPSGPEALGSAGALGSARAPAAPGGPWLFPLSSMSPAGVTAQARRLADWLDEHPGAPLASVGYTLARRRSHLACRATVVGAGAAELAAGLRALEPGTPVNALRTATGRAAPAWVFSGHGAQWTGMGRQLLACEPVFARVMADLEEIYQTLLGFSPAEAITEGDWSAVGRVQAMTFAMQAGLAEVWRSRGVEPGAIIGHSVGEISAAVAAGVLDRDEAAVFACRRAAILQRAAGLGGMAMAALSFGEAAERLAGRRDVVPAIATAPSWTVVSGGTAALEEVTARWAAEGVVIRRVGTDVPFHSAFMDPLLGDVAAAAAGLTSAPPRVPLYSTVTPDPRSPAARDGAYWAAMLRDPVRFTGAIAAAAEDGHRIFTEISSHPIVTHSIGDILAGLGIADAAVGYTLRRGEPELETLLASLGAAHAAGADVDWARLYPAGELVSLPPMAWQHRGYWASPPTGRGTGGGHDPASHTLLGAGTVVNGSRPLRLWQTYLDFGCRPYPGAHPVRGVEIVPAAVLLTTLLRAASGAPAGTEVAGTEVAALREVDLRIPLAVTEPRLVQVVLDERSLRLSSRLAGTGADGDGGAPAGSDEHEWLTHTTAVVDSPPLPASPDSIASCRPEALPARRKSEPVITGSD